MAEPVVCCKTRGGEAEVDRTQGDAPGEYNPFRSMGGCAKLWKFQWKCNRKAVDRGFGFTVSLRTGAVFLKRPYVGQLNFGRKTAVFLYSRCSSKNSPMDDPARPCHTQ